MKRYFLLMIVVLLSNFAFGGDGNGAKEVTNANTKLVSGKIIDKKSGEEIAGAEIKIADKTIYTDLNGNFFAIILTGKTEALITSISYSDTKINIDPFSCSEIIIELESK